jgi:hypothetical protein
VSFQSSVEIGAGRRPPDSGCQQSACPNGGAFNQGGDHQDSYQQGYRAGYQQGFSDGRQACDSHRNADNRGGGFSQSEYDRGSAEGYNAGHRAASGGGAPASQAGSMAVDSRGGWQTLSNLFVHAGQRISVTANGAWTVDRRYHAYVGPDGYGDKDSYIWQGCKMFNVPYGVLLAQVGNTVLQVGSSAVFQAPNDGPVQFRIHDTDRCLGDNDGQVTVQVNIG